MNYHGNDETMGKLLVLAVVQTTVVNQLKLEKNIPETAAIISAVIETVNSVTQRNNYCILRDVGRHDRLLPLFRHYFSE
jgi:hypothetical protein